MSNIYIQEPPSDGKVLLETTVGDIDIELWSREAPKACRNFIQLCMEGYYDKTIFHRVVKGFIVQGGDPTGTGTGGNSIWGKPFKDEIHSRLRFVRRGLVAMANAGRDDNGSQFFFTLGATPELQNKHTIFGKVGGETIYNMIKLEEGIVDEDDRPAYPHKILKTKVLNNPFPDIVPRQSIQSLSKQDKKSKKSSAVATKNFNLLSFGEEAEEEEEEIGEVNKQFTGKGKSSHDLTNDPKLSSEPALVAEASPEKSAKSESEDDSEAEGTEIQPAPFDVQDQLSTIKEKLLKKSGSSTTDKKKKKVDVKVSDKNDKESDEEEYYLGKDEKMAEKKRLDGIKKEYRELKKSMRKEKTTLEEDKALEKKEAAEKEAQRVNENSVIQAFMDEQKFYKEKKTGVKKGDEREAQTLALLNKFKSKIASAKETFPEEEAANAVIPPVEEDIVDPTDISWLARSLHKDQDELVLAKDANKKSDDWYEMYDPKNPLNKRRREESKKNEGEKWKRLKPID